MARLSRLVFSGVALHVIQRGNNRSACFREDSDYLTYLAQLRQLATKHECDLHAYCLMTNHVHLLLTPQHAEACSLLMRDLGRSYVQYFNRPHARSGTLWEGRFRSCLVESPSYVIACHRYIELNPVRAGMVSEPAAYPWSSHASNVGLRPDPGLTAHCEFLALSGRSPQASYGGSLTMPWMIEWCARFGRLPMATIRWRARASSEQAGRARLAHAARETGAARAVEPDNRGPDPELAICA